MSQLKKEKMTPADLQAYYAALQKNIENNVGAENCKFEIVDPPKSEGGPSWMSKASETADAKEMVGLQGETSVGNKELDGKELPDHVPLLKCTITFKDDAGNEVKGSATYDPKAGGIRTDLDNDASVKAALEIAKGLGSKGVVLPKDFENKPERAEQIRQLCEEKGLKCSIQGSDKDLELPAVGMTAGG